MITRFINLRLLQEFNDGVQRSMDAYWRDTHPIAEFERRLRAAAKSRRYNERKKAQRG